MKPKDGSDFSALYPVLIFLMVIFSWDLCIYSATAAPVPAGEVRAMQGSGSRVSMSGAKVILSVGEKIFEGDLINTSDDASLTLAMVDGSEMTLGPKSEFKIEDIEKEKPSIFSMAFGSLKAKISKSMTGDVKTVIKTKTATMGVRGTEFYTQYNSEKSLTSIVTVEGEVALKANSETTNAETLDFSNAVSVVQGQYSGLTNSSTVPTEPIRISPVQLESLRQDQAIVQARSNDTVNDISNEKTLVTDPITATGGPEQPIHLVPPGVDPALVAPTAKDIQSVAEVSGVTAVTISDKAPEPNRNGFVPGGFVDLNAGVYVSPPPGSSYDAVAGVYVPPPALAQQFDAKTGQFNASSLVQEQAMQQLNQNNVDTSQHTMVAAPPPPGVDPSVLNKNGSAVPSATEFVFGARNDGSAVLDNRTVGIKSGIDPGSANSNAAKQGPLDGALVPGFDGFQPQYPVYNPFMCPPYCDPASQPGSVLPPPPAGPGTTTLNFILSQMNILEAVHVNG